MQSNKKISTLMLSRLTACLFAVFAITTLLLFLTTTSNSETRTGDQLQKNIEDVCRDVDEKDSVEMVDLVRLCAKRVETNSSLRPGTNASPEAVAAMLQSIAYASEVEEVVIVDANGIIEASNVPEYIGYDMASAEQSAEFMCLINNPGVTEFIQELRSRGIDSLEQRRYCGTRFENRDGFLQIGVTPETYALRMKASLSGITHNRRIGESGSIIVTDKLFEVLSAPGSYEGKHLQDLGIDPSEVLEHEQMTPFQITIGVASCYCMYSVAAGGHVIIANIPVHEATLTRNQSLVNGIVSILVVFIFLIVLTYRLVRRLVVNNIDEVNDSLEKIAHGNLSEQVEVHGTTEFNSLSTGINTMVDKLKDYIHQAETRMDADLALAHSIQLGTLPSIFPAFPQWVDYFDLYANMEPAKEVGGDFYDFYFVGKNRLALVVADVSGKGIPAAMFMMRSKALIKNLAATDITPEEVVTRANEQLSTGNDLTMFMTLWMCVVDLEQCQMTFIDGGHNAPLMRLNGGQYAYVKEDTDIPLGAMEGYQYRPHTIGFAPGDELFLYTDGVTEAANPDYELYGDGRLCSLLNGAEGTMDSKTLCGRVLADVATFADGAPQSDDITVLSFKFKKRV